MSRQPQSVTKDTDERTFGTASDSGENNATGALEAKWNILRRMTVSFSAAQGLNVSIRCMFQSHLVHRRVIME